MDVLYQMEIVDCNRAKKTTSQARDDGKTALLEFRLLNEHYADSAARYARPHGIRETILAIKDTSRAIQMGVVLEMQMASAIGR